MPGTWLYIPVNSYDDIVTFKIGTTTFTGSSYFLAANNGSAPYYMQLGISQNYKLGLIVFIPDGTALPTTADVQDSTTMVVETVNFAPCELVGGQPRVPNR